MTTRAGRLMANIKPYNLTESAGGIIADLKALGLTIHEESTNSFALNAAHRHRVLHDTFLKNGWRLTFNGTVAGGLKQAAYAKDTFGGGKAVLHFKEDTASFVTLSFSRNYYD